MITISIITISDISPIEFHSAFLKRVRTQEMDQSLVSQVFQLFDSDLESFHVVEVDQEVKQVAAQLLDAVAWERGLRTLDALQLATALTSHQVIPLDYFVSSDRKLLGVAEDYLQTFNPEDG